MRNSSPFVVTIIGAGKVGSVLGKLLTLGGQDLACIVSRTISSARNAAKFTGCKFASTSLGKIPEDTNLIIIATPHEKVAVVAEKLAVLNHLRFKGLKVCHTSGMMTAAVLEPLEKKGAVVFSFHPLQTFPRAFAPKDIVENARGIYYGIDGSPRAVRTAKRLARILQGRIVEIPAELRALYHAVCVVASNHLTTMLWVIQRMYGKLGGKRREFFEVFRPIVDATMRNVERTSPAKALSGPVARGGVETVAGHFEALKEHAPEFLPYFVSMTMETARLALEKGSLSRDRYGEMYRLIESHRTKVQKTGTSR